MGGLLVLLGAVLIFRPFASLAVLILLLVVAFIVAGVSELLRREPNPGVWRYVQGIAYLLAAVFVLVWPGATIRVVALAVAVVLLLGGLADLAIARRVGGTARFNAVVGGGASIVFGLLALTWPDVTVLVVAVVFGARMIIAGVRQLAAFVKGDDVSLWRPRPAAKPPRGGWLRVTGTVLGAALALILVVVSIALHRSTPSPDAFYDPPTSVPTVPGQLVRSEPYTSDEIPAGARAWRILYTTTRDEGRPAVASGLVIAPASALIAGGSGSGEPPSKIIAWAHGTTGFAPGCAPSVLPNGLAAGAMMIEKEVIAQGWTLVATDYVGLGTKGPHPYLIGQGEGRSVIDAVRAARQLKNVSLAQDTVVWGHSQGGHAALWTGILAPAYAPDVKIDGVAALAPASDLPGLIDNLGDFTGGAVFGSFVIAAYTAIYPDVRTSDVVRPGARILSDEMADRCLAEKSVLVSALSAIALDKSIWTGDPDRGAFGQRLKENVPSGPIRAPLLIMQGAVDGLITPAAQARYVKARCEAGYHLDYRTYVGRGHLSVVEPDSPAIPELLAWTTNRFEGEPAKTTC
ncbi:lipase family protein [Microlunatus sp. Gsoil 973]|uniref:lipase family protein n=1 Tax=Microlunatus sp. Gsoil 973 TaxID=2672569 RepID=UPI001E622C63|nr:lipase family protein [Microlunatus sp. Gsoil 973]